MEQRTAWQVTCLALPASLALLGWASEAGAQASFVGPVPYLSSADIPTGFYPAGLSAVIEDFEDCSLDFGITASDGTPIFRTLGGGCAAGGDLVDSVDADDGTIDGSGSEGRSFHAGVGPTGITLTFASPVAAAAAVWTDGFGMTTFEAFGPGMVSLGTIGPVMIADGSVFGTTADDHFFGVQDPNGIVAIKLSNTAGGIEIDHVQFAGVPAVPVLGAEAWVALALLVALTAWIVGGRALTVR